MAIGLRGVLREAWKKEGTHTMVSERVLKIRMRLRDCYLTVIAVYAPTSVDEEVESEKFYELLQDQIDEVSKKDFLIVLGDFNARVGPQAPHLDFTALTILTKGIRMGHGWLIYVTTMVL